MSSQLRRNLINISVLRFGLVGLFATLTYYYFAIFFGEVLFSYSIMVTNLAAYCVAMFVSYAGHYFWTYNAQGSHGATFAKYVVSAFFGSALNSAVIYICMYFSMQYKSAMFTAIILVPAVAYLINKKWVFRAG